MMGHEIIPKLNTLNDKDEEELESQLARCQFPTDKHLCSRIAGKYWIQQYNSACGIIFDLSEIKISS